MRCPDGDSWTSSFPKRSRSTRIGGIRSRIGRRRSAGSRGSGPGPLLSAGVLTSIPCSVRCDRPPNPADSGDYGPGERARAVADQARCPAGAQGRPNVRASGSEAVDRSTTPASLEPAAAPLNRRSGYGEDRPDGRKLCSWNGRCGPDADVRMPDSNAPQSAPHGAAEFICAGQRRDRARRFVCLAPGVRDGSPRLWRGFSFGCSPRTPPRLPVTSYLDHSFLRKALL